MKLNWAFIIIIILLSFCLYVFVPFQMDEANNGLRDPASVPLRGADVDPQDDDRSSKHAADLQKKVEEEGKRQDSAPNVHSFMSASVLESDEATSVSGEDEVNMTSLFHSRNRITTILKLF